MRKFIIAVLIFSIGNLCHAKLPAEFEASTKLAQKLDELTPLLKHEHQSLVDLEVLPLIVSLAAPYDPVLAQSYADRLKYDHWVRAYIEISTHLCPEKAQLFLNQVKQKYFYDDSALILVCREEFRRGLSEREETLKRIVEAQRNNYQVCELAELFLDFHLEMPTGFLERAHEEKMGEVLLSPLMDQYSLRDLLRVEAKAESSLAFETLQALRENTDKIRESLLNDKEYDFSPEFAALKYIEAWIHIIQIEAISPFLASELEKDVSFVLNAIKELKKEYISDTEDFDVELRELESVIADCSSKTLEVLNAIEDDFYQFQASIILIEAGHPHKEELIQHLIQYAEKENEHPVDQIEVYTQLFDCMALLHDLEQALPYLEKAKTYLSEIDDEDGELQEALYEILNVELDYQLPSAQQTLKILHQTIREASYVLPEAIEIIIRAELSLLIDTFSKDIPVTEVNLL